ncbi:MAG: hypothetical protein CL910_09915 [Deltaproteobacteria bacterium]|nr:hypothetical protein [Deltaproteobacteria bacterium]
MNGEMRQVRVPYRLSPLGAHTDHQDGLTSGFTLDRGITLTFRATEAAVVRLSSSDFPGAVEIPLGGPLEDVAHWSAYPRGVVHELGRRHELTRGIEGEIKGELPPGGISSSAAVQVAVLLALLEANEIRMSRIECTELVRAAEQASTGVRIGLLDPAVILHGKEQALVVIDCHDAKINVHRMARRAQPFAWYLVDSGVERELRETPYNERVTECAAAARALGAPDDRPVLRAVTPEQYRRQRKELDPTLVRRAEHYFSEVKRVKLGQQALASGDVVSLGRLVTASGESLTQNYDCGTPETRRLLALLLEVEIVWGASYAGGGWGGLLQVLAGPGAAAALEAVVARYRDEYPEVGVRARVISVGMGPGAHVA